MNNSTKHFQINCITIIFVSFFQLFLFLIIIKRSVFINFRREKKFYHFRILISMHLAFDTSLKTQKKSKIDRKIFSSAFLFNKWWCSTCLDWNRTDRTDDHRHRISPHSCHSNHSSCHRPNLKRIVNGFFFIINFDLKFSHQMHTLCHTIIVVVVIIIGIDLRQPIAEHIIQIVVTRPYNFHVSSIFIENPRWNFYWHFIETECEPRSALLVNGDQTLYERIIDFNAWVADVQRLQFVCQICKLYDTGCVECLTFWYMEIV